MFIMVKKTGNNTTIHQLVLISKQWDNNEWCKEWLLTCMTTCNNMDNSQKHYTNKPNKKQYINMIPLIFDILEKAKRLGQEADQWLLLVVRLERELNSSCCHNSVYICQTWTLHFKSMNYFACKFDFNKATEKIIMELGEGKKIGFNTFEYIWGKGLGDFKY